LEVAPSRAESTQVATVCTIEEVIVAAQSSMPIVTSVNVPDGDYLMTHDSDEVIVQVDSGHINFTLQNKEISLETVNIATIVGHLQSVK
jgi:hypothetical protein